MKLQKILSSNCQKKNILVLKVISTNLKKIYSLTGTDYPKTCWKLEQNNEKQHNFMGKQLAETPAREAEELYWCWVNLFCFVQWSLGEIQTGNMGCSSVFTVQLTFDFICVSAPLILNAEVLKVWNLSKIFYFAKVCLATLQINLIIVIIRPSGQISTTIRPDGQIPENRPDIRITRYEPDIRCDPNVVCT